MSCSYTYLCRPPATSRLSSTVYLPPVQPPVSIQAPPRSVIYQPDLSMEERGLLKNWYIYDERKSTKKPSPSSSSALTEPSSSSSSSGPTEAASSSPSETPSSKSSVTSAATPPPTTSKTPSSSSAPTKDSKPTKDSNEKCNGVCGTDEDGVQNICGSAKNLFPIMDPQFNMREVAKNMILLEDHLFHEGKRCQDCILKHCLTIEALLEEGVTLDKKNEVREQLNRALVDFRGIFRDLAQAVRSDQMDDDKCTELAQRIRRIRKPLCQQYAMFGY